MIGIQWVLKKYTLNSTEEEHNLWNSEINNLIKPFSWLSGEVPSITSIVNKLYFLPLIVVRLHPVLGSGRETKMSDFPKQGPFPPVHSAQALSVSSSEQLAREQGTCQQPGVSPGTTDEGRADVSHNSRAFLACRPV